MTIRVEFYEPPMCCPTGVCGPSVDDKLVRVQENVDSLKKKYQDALIERYQISQQPAKFKENEEVYKIVKEQGKTSLPITTVNGKVVKVGEYPTLEEIEARIAGE
jgi:phage shock protein A